MEGICGYSFEAIVNCFGIPLAVSGTAGRWLSCGFRPDLGLDIVYD
jgi:hypothetical protein